MAGRKDKRNFLTIRRSMIHNKRGVTEIGRKSDSSSGRVILGTGVITALSQRRASEVPQWRVRFIIWVTAGVSSIAKYLKSQYGVLSGPDEFSLWRQVSIYRLCIHIYTDSETFDVRNWFCWAVKWWYLELKYYCK